MIFLGEPRNEDIAGSVHSPSNLWIRLPLGILAFITLFIAIWQGGIVHYIVGKEVVEPEVEGLTAFMLSCMLIIFLIVVGLYVKGLNLLYKIASHHFVQTIHQVLFNGYFVEAMITWISKNIFVNALAASARWFDTYIIDYTVNITVPITKGVYNIFKTGHTGRIGAYMGQFVTGVAIIVISILIIVKGL